VDSKAECDQLYLAHVLH